MNHLIQSSPHPHCPMYQHDWALDTWWKIVTLHLTSSALYDQLLLSYLGALWSFCKSSFKTQHKINVQEELYTAIFPQMFTACSDQMKGTSTFIFLKAWMMETFDIYLSRFFDMELWALFTVLQNTRTRFPGVSQVWYLLSRFFLPWETANYIQKGPKCLLREITNKRSRNQPRFSLRIYRVLEVHAVPFPETSCS